MSEDITFSDGSGFPACQYAFFSKEGGQWVFRGNNVASVHGLLEELLTLADETDGPGLLSTIQSIKAAGLIKEATGASSGGNRQGSSSGGSSGIPGWLQEKADELGGKAVMGEKNGRKWYAVKVNDEMKWQQAPRG